MPPTGVIAPSHRIPVRLSAYRLPEKSTVPATNNQPLAFTAVPGQRVHAQATASRASA